MSRSADSSSSWSVITKNAADHVESAGKKMKDDGVEKIKNSRLRLDTVLWARIAILKIYSHETNYNIPLSLSAGFGQDALYGQWYYKNVYNNKIFLSHQTHSFVV